MSDDKALYISEYHPQGPSPEDVERERRLKIQQAIFDAKVRRYGYHLMSGEVVFDPELLSRNPRKRPHDDT